jgi:hypothetical protein
MRIFARDIESPAERRRAVMKVCITLYGGISLYARRKGAYCGTGGDEREAVIAKILARPGLAAHLRGELSRDRPCAGLCSSCLVLLCWL